ncbi:MAG: DUF1206 domain-containing protein [Ilumatobacteraceae bacterium]
MPTSIAANSPARRPRHSARRFTADHPGIVACGRAGWCAKGLVYVIAGALILAVAAKASGWATTAAANEEASPTGAFATVADSTGGSLVLVLLAAGMLLYAGWRLVTAALPGATDASAMLHRVGYVVSAIMYTTFAITAIELARNSQADQDGNRRVSDLSASVMEHTAGRLVIGLVAVIVMVVGAYRVSKGVRVDVTDEMNLGGMSADRVRWTKRLGAAGEIGRGIGIGLVGFFMLRAAITYRSAEATGLDGALRRLAEQSWGQVVVALVGIGFVAYGIFCLATFTHRQLQAP